MTGGYSARGRELSSTEFIYVNGSVIQGPELPKGRYGHCMVDLRDGRYMIIGGNPTRKEVLIYHQSNMSFARGPSLLVGRYFHACAVINSPLYGIRVMVAGGWGPEIRSVEILDFSSTSSVWQESE